MRDKEDKDKTQLNSELKELIRVIKFREIELITGETDLDKLVDRFIQVRTPNLAMFALIPNDHLLGYYPQEYWFIIIELIICNVEFLRRLRR